MKENAPFSTYGILIKFLTSSFYECKRLGTESRIWGTVGLEVKEQLYALYLFLFPPVALAPTNLMAVQEGRTGIRLSWTPPTQGDTTGYRISYSGGSSGGASVSDGSTDNHLLTDLVIGASYTIRIVSTSEHFCSDSVMFPNITLGELLHWRSTGACAMIITFYQPMRHIIMCHDNCALV